MSTPAPILALLATLATATGSMRLWWLHAPRMESRYLLDYCRLTLGMPSYRVWPYRIEAVQYLPITVLPDAVYDGRPLWQVLLWPLIATAAVGLCSLFLAAVVGSGTQRNQGKVLRGPRLISNFQWWLGQLGRKKGFYIQQ